MSACCAVFWSLRSRSAGSEHHQLCDACPLISRDRRLRGRCCPLGTLLQLLALRAKPGRRPRRDGKRGAAALQARRWVWACVSIVRVWAACFRVQQRSNLVRVMLHCSTCLFLFCVSRGDPPAPERRFPFPARPPASLALAWASVRRRKCPLQHASSCVLKGGVSILHPTPSPHHPLSRCNRTRRESKNWAVGAHHLPPLPLFPNPIFSGRIGASVVNPR